MCSMIYLSCCIFQLDLVSFVEWKFIIISETFSVMEMFRLFSCQTLTGLLNIAATTKSEFWYWICFNCCCNSLMQFVFLVNCYAITIEILATIAQTNPIVNNFTGVTLANYRRKVMQILLWNFSKPIGSICQLICKSIFSLWLQMHKNRWCLKDSELSLCIWRLSIV